ncbi:hypothetical protein PMAYCL1PPCAC_31557, partial [Pristionchus mayeri]
LIMTCVASISTNRTPEWEILHINEFCPENVEMCQHECMIEGLDDVFNFLNENLKPNNIWRKAKKVCYGVDKVKHYCIICVSQVSDGDHCIGVYQKIKGAKHLNAYVMHDTCLSTISQNKEAVLPAIKFMLKNANVDIIKSINKYCIFESKKTCYECKRDLFVEKYGKGKIICCSDPFCGKNMHRSCVITSTTCRVDFYAKTIYCKDHEKALTQPNEAAHRGIELSQTPIEYEICVVCSEKVARWPLRGKIFYLTCCESFVHYGCATSRFQETRMQCQKCSSMNRYLESIQKQGHCLLDYSEEMKRNKIGYYNPERAENFLDESMVEDESDGGSRIVECVEIDEEMEESMKNCYIKEEIATPGKENRRPKKRRE